MKVDPEFKACIPALSQEERAALEEGLLNEGCRDALVVWEGHDVLLDGHNRLEICEKHGIAYQTVERDFPDRRSARIWIRENQRARRNLTKSQLAVLAAENTAEFEAEAKERQGTRTDLDSDFRQKFAQSQDNPDEGRALTRAGKAFGVSREYVRQARNLTDELTDQVRAGAMTLAQAADHQAIGARIEELPEDERERANAFLKSLIAAGNHTSHVVDMAGKLPAKPIEERLRIYALHENGGERERSLAITSAANLPPMPHPSLKPVTDARRLLRKAQKRMPYAAKERTDAICSELVELEALIEEEA